MPRVQLRRVAVTVAEVSARPNKLMKEQTTELNRLDLLPENG